MLTFIFVAIALFSGVFFGCCCEAFQIRGLRKAWMSVISLCVSFWSLVAAIICYNWF